jgi:hypothetical protein
VKNVCIYGAWLDYPTNGKLFNRGSTNDKKRLTKKQKEVEAWLTTTLLDQGMTTNMQGVTHA